MHLLLCTDGTFRSSASLAFGCRLATRLKAQVTILAASARPARKPDLLPSLAGACADLNNAGLRCDTAIWQEPPRRAIVAQANQGDYDLVIVGLLERGWIRRWLRGPSIRRVLRDVTTPVLVVPADRLALHRILLCSGDLWYPEETVRLVGQIARSTEAEVTLLYVIPQPLLSYPILREIEDAWGALLQTDTLQGRNLRIGRDTLRDLDIETVIKLRHGPVADQIMSEIREGEYDMVALGSTYAAQSLRRYFVSSITDLVVEHAGRPVLVVRHHKA
jgi:nucleotide-binding universal stress UspA family protein